MKFCLACQQSFINAHWKYSACGNAPAGRGGFAAFELQPAAQHQGFNMNASMWPAARKAA